MTFLGFDFSDVVEPRAVPADFEYKIRIVEVRDGVDKNGNPYLLPRFEILNEVGAKDFTHFLGLPNDSMDPKRLNTCKYKIKTFLDGFGLAYDSDTNDWLGAEAWAILGVENTDQWGEQNFIKKVIRS